MNWKVSVLIILLFSVQYAIGGWPPAIGSILGIFLAMGASTIAEYKTKQSRKGE